METPTTAQVPALAQVPASAPASGSAPAPASARRTRRRAGVVGALALVLAGGLGLSACSASPGSPGAPSESSETAAAVAIPDTTVGTQLTWMIDLLNAGTDLTADQIAGNFTKSFLAEAPAGVVAEQMNTGVRPDRPFVVTGYQDLSDDLGAARITGASGKSLSLEMRVEEDGMILEMLVRQAPEQ